MFVTIRQILSLMGKDEFVSIYNNDTEEIFGTVEECEDFLPNCVLDTMVSSIHACLIDGKAIFVIYKECGE